MKNACPSDTLTPPNSSLSGNPSGLAEPGAALKQRDHRLQAMKELVSHLAHSFNNALAPMAGYITLLADELQPATAGGQYLGKLGNSLRKSQLLIEAVVQATHPEKQFVPRTTQFDHLLRRIVESWTNSLPASARIAVGLELVPCTLELDERLWTKAVEHLLSNAQLALGDGGAIQVTLQKRALSETEAGELGWAAAEAWCLAIQDSGVGMTQEVLERAFEPLFTSRPNLPTTGLGLALVHSVVHLHGGQVVLESTPDLGSTVTVWLPAAG